MDNTNKSTFIVFSVEAEKIVNASATSVIDSILERVQFMRSGCRLN